LHGLGGLEWLVPPVLSSKVQAVDPAQFSFAPDDLSLHLFTVQIDFTGIGKTRSAVMRELAGKGVGSQVLYIPVYLQPWYRRSFGYAAGKCPNAENFYARALSLPLYPAMTDKDVESVIGAVQKLA